MTTEHSTPRQRVIRPGDQFRLTTNGIPGRWLTVIEVDGDLVRTESGKGGQSTWSAASLATGYGGSVAVEWRRR